MKPIAVRASVSFPVKRQEWFYLPPEQEKWTLNTKDAFSLDDSEFLPDSNDYLPT